MTEKWAFGFIKKIITVRRHWAAIFFCHAFLHVLQSFAALGFFYAEFLCNFPNAVSLSTEEVK